MKNWKLLLGIFAVGIVVGYLLHRPEIIGQQESTTKTHFEANNTSHSDRTADSTKTDLHVRTLDVTPPAARTGQVFGKPRDTVRCSKFDLHFVATDSAGFIDAWIWGIDGIAHSVDSTRLTPSHRNFVAIDTFSKTSHTEIRKDSTSFVSRDSNDHALIVTKASHSLYDLSVELSTPVFQNMTFGVQPLAMLVRVPARLHFTDVFTAGLEPEFMLLAPSISSSRIYLDVQFKIAGR